MNDIGGPVVDLNADLGEAFGNWSMGDDEAMLQVVTSANIACGFHAGDPRTMRRTIALAIERSVVIGAHVAYPDLVGFGRRRMDLEPDELEADVLYQLAALDGMCRAAGGRVRYVKAHGALYHRANADPGQAAALLAAVAAFDRHLPILCSGTGAIAAAAASMSAAAAAPIRLVAECFADRLYGADGGLVPRTEPGAVIADPAAVAAQALDLTRSGRYGSVCLHGDTPGAVEHAVAVREALRAAGIVIRPFVDA